MKELKKIVYATEPMEKMLEAEQKKKVKVLKGEKLDFNCVTLDEDVLDMVAA